MPWVLLTEKYEIKLLRGIFMEIPTADYFEQVSYRTANSWGIPSSHYISLQEVNS